MILEGAVLKTCSKCGISLPIEDFYLHTTGRPFGSGKTCYTTAVLDRYHQRVGPKPKLADVLEHREDHVFSSRVEKTFSCWFWPGAKAKFGYGLVSLRAGTTVAHRVSWILSNGEIPH